MHLCSKRKKRQTEDWRA